MNMPLLKDRGGGLTGSYYKVRGGARALLIATAVDRHRAHRAEPPLRLSWRVATRASEVYAREVRA